jgi:glycosyltransferase involved in cell wall biosynthesis
MTASTASEKPDSMASHPTIGVLITSYNYRQYIPDCLESVFNQDAPFDEILVIDDGSEDGSVELLRCYEPRLRVIAKRNEGQLSALLAGIAAMQSDYVYTLDIDDYLAPGFVREIKPHLLRRPAKIQFQLIGVDANKSHLGSIFPTYPRTYGAVEMIEDNRVIGFYQCPPTSGNIFRRDILVGMELERMNLRDAIDGLPVLAIPYLGRVVSINQPLAYYRAHGGSDSRWDKPDSGLLKRELDRFHLRWTEVCRLLDLNQPPFGLDMPLYVLERNLMQVVFERRRAVTADVFAYARKLLEARLPARQKALLLMWSLAFLIPLLAWRRQLVLARRSPLNRPAALQTLINVITRIPAGLASDGAPTAANAVAQKRWFM